MAESISLDEQIVAVLTGLCTSEQAAAVLADAKTVMEDLDKRSEAADVASLSPLATSEQARKVRAEARELRFEADRMEASVSALEARLADLKDAEAAARKQAETDKIRATRDALAEDIRKEYPEIVLKLTNLAKRIFESDRDCQRVNLTSAEALGRGVPGNFYSQGTPVMRIIQRPLPTVDGIRMAWEDVPMHGRIQYWGLGETLSADGA